MAEPAKSNKPMVAEDKSLTKRQKIDILVKELEQEFSTFRAQYRDLNDYILPIRGRFWTGDGNKGDRRNLKIIDGTATKAARTLRAGFTSGATSPARPWFKLEAHDPDLNKFPRVQEWLYKVTEIMLKSFTRSNYYQTKPLVYGDMGVFGTGCYMFEEHFKNVFHTTSFPIGSYTLAKDPYGKVDTFSRKFRMTVAQMVKFFGTLDKYNRPDWSNFSEQVKRLYYQGNYNAWIEVGHVIHPNDEYNPDMLHSKFKKFSSCYYETGTGFGNAGNYLGSSQRDELYLREAGYDYFPILAPRWEVAGEDVYGTDCPGMISIGDIKQLQWGEKKIAQAIDKIINPPMKGPSALRGQKTSTLPGDTTYTDEREGQSGFRPVYQIDARIQEMELKQKQLRERISQYFYEDLFLMMIDSDRRQITAREIDERSEEKLLALGPVMQQLDQDDLDPSIDIVFNFLLNQGQIPPPPEELRGQPLHVEYISTMAQAQKMIGIGTVERFASFAGNLVAPFPGAVKKINVNKVLDTYGGMLSLPPGLLRSDDEVAAIEAQEQQAVAAQQKLEAISQGSAAAKNLAGANLDSDNALSRVLDNAQAGNLINTP